ncbi:EpsG family protein [Paenibacillus sp. LPE1-1-1.1]|uniref:EpsG family protein n=1 Tax=Paenibacillus sp. LPE1-1-1.1 TaxID=3135230 RepID=UPI003444DB51
MIIYFVVVCLMMILSFVADPLKIRFKFLKQISLLFVLMFLVFNTDNPDFQIYNEIFEFNDPNGIADIGFIMIIKLIKYLGGDSYRIILIIQALLLFITFSRFSKYIKNINFVILLYFIFPYIMDVIQVRNNLMFFLVLNALIEYIHNKKVKSLIFLIFATMLHSFGFVFFIVFFVIELFVSRSVRIGERLDSHKIGYQNNKVFYNIIITLGIINIIAGRSFVDLILNKFPIEFVRVKIQYYYADSLNLGTLFSWSLLLIVDIIIFYNLIKRKEQQLNKSNNIKMITILYFFLFTGILLLGCMLYLFEFNRFYRGLFIVKYLLYGCIEKYLNEKEKLFMRAYLILTSVLMAVIYYLRGIDYDHILWSNLLFD